MGLEASTRNKLATVQKENDDRPSPPPTPVFNAKHNPFYVENDKISNITDYITSLLSLDDSFLIPKGSRKGIKNY